jgi:hypothetical protein
MLPKAVKGARNSGLTITWKHPNGSAHNLTGSALTGFIRNRLGTVRAIDGTLALSDASNGVFTWAFGDVDVGTAGKFSVQFVATYTANSLSDKTYIEDWVVEEELTT